MPAYILALIEVTDPEGYKAYAARTPGVIAQYGGRFVVRGGPRTEKEGDWPEARTVLLEFPDRAAAERFYHSPEYQEILQIRLATSQGRLCILNGVP